MMKIFSLTIPGNGQIQAPSDIHTFGINDIIPPVITILIVIAVILTLFFLVYGGISWITSGGEKQKLEGARSKITYAIIGLIIVFLSFFIINIIGGIFNINLLNTSF